MAENELKQQKQPCILFFILSFFTLVRRWKLMNVVRVVVLFFSSFFLKGIPPLDDTKRFGRLQTEIIDDGREPTFIRKKKKKNCLGFIKLSKLYESGFSYFFFFFVFEIFFVFTFEGHLFDGFSSLCFFFFLILFFVLKVFFFF